MSAASATQMRILMADDDPLIVEMLSGLLDDEGYAVDGVLDGTAVRARLADGEQYDLLLLDLQMPGASGLEILEQLRNDERDTPVIILTAHGTSSVAIRAMQLGAYDYVQKPFDLNEVASLVRRVFEHRAMAARLSLLDDRVGLRDRMIGSSPVMNEVYKTIGRIAGSVAAVLITGETGTGKELAANLIHQYSARSQGPLLKVNCAALPEALIESELFGHEKGSFTGAMTQRKGRFELAHGGTIVLDEVGEITLPVQKKLLRVLQEGEVERVGSSQVISVDVRVIAATNRDLRAEVANGSFREDLFYRLNVIGLRMPPLRERRGDIPLLIAHFLDKYRHKPGTPPSRISDEALEQLQGYDWPGNVRQLENEIERAVVLAQGNVITPQTLNLSQQGMATHIDLAARVRQRESLGAVLEYVERTMIVEALRQGDGDHDEAARRLGLTSDELRRRLSLTR